MRPAFLIAAALLALPLAACKKEAPSATGAAGQVLPGSISDAMLPEDRVTSQPPIDPGAARPARSGAAGEEQEEASATPTGAPGETPTPQAAASRPAE